LDAVVAVNTMRPAQLCAMVEHAVGSLRGAHVALLGLAFKPGTDDVRDSPALAVARLLAKAGAKIRAFDPIIRHAPEGSGWDALLTVCDSPADALAGADAAVVATAWPEFVQWNWTELAKGMRGRIIVDGRNSLRGATLPPDMRYLAI